ncbi:Hypothetical protein A7982_09533 [Minicystis rosea]|nr:Hypothetical protein A7982_09533 [Minicystis rosea]
MPALRLVGLAVSLVLASITFGCGSSTGGTGGNGGGTGGSGGGTGGSGGGTFLCKGLMCVRGQDACTVTSHMSAGDEGECTTLPTACQTPDADCDCFGDLMGCTCQKQPAGELAIFCDLSM